MATNVKHGKNGLIYVSGSELLNANSWNLTITSATAESSVFGDSWVSRVKGLNDFSGSVVEHQDQDSKVIVTAATATVSVALLIYPDRADLTTYYSGNAFFGGNSAGNITSLVSRGGDFVGDGALTATGFS